MQRVILASTLSFVAGIGAGYWFFNDAADRAAAPALPAATIPSNAPGTSAASGDAVRPAAPAVAERARVYQSVASAGVDELRAMALAALDDADRGRSFELDVVLARLIEIDPDVALTFAREQNLDPARKLELALNLLDTSAYTEQALDRLVAALPGLDRDQLRNRALERLAAADPEQALQIALSAPDTRSERWPVLGAIGPGPQPLFRIGAVWAGRDPDGALAAIDTIADMQARFLFSQAVLGGIAQSDPELALTYLDVIDMPRPQRTGLLQTAIAQLASRDPERALQYAEALGGQDGQAAMTMTVQQWARRDAAAAIAYVETMPASMSRQNLVQQIATVYGWSDPDAALAWAQSLTSGQTQAYAGVVAGIAQSDPLRALDLALDDSALGLPPGVQQQALMGVIAGAATNGGIPYRTLADRLLTLESSQSQQNTLQMLVQTWASTEPDGALDWLMSNQQSIGPNAFGNVARQLGRRDPQSAALYTGRVAPELRDQWISAVASGYAQNDPDGARAWAEQFRGQPAYEVAVTEVIRFSAGSDPASAAALWESVDFESPEQRTQLASTIARSWGPQDWPAARNWVATLPPGDMRDSALTGMVLNRPEIPDASFMSLFSSDGARQQAISNVIVQTAQYDPGRARAMAAEHLSDPQRREQVEQTIVNIETRQAPGVIYQGPVPAVGLRSSAGPFVVR